MHRKVVGLLFVLAVGLLMCAEQCSGCYMPEEIPEDLRGDINQTYWNQLREQQIRRGCDNNNNVKRCVVRSTEIVTLLGECRDLNGHAVCLVFDKRYHKYTRMRPYHRDCGSRLSRRRATHSRRRTNPTDGVLRAWYDQAEARSQLGLLPSRMDLSGNVLPTRRCKVHQRVPVNNEGRCVNLPANNTYGCRYERSLILWHPACSDLNTNATQPNSRG